MKHRTLFMGTPAFAVPTLQAMLDAGWPLVGVVCQPDRPAGRGQKLAAPPVKELALAHGLPVFQPERVRRNPEFLETVKALAPDVIVVVAYGNILPKELLEVPPYGCLNLHGSILPRYRGAAPIQWSLIQGDTTTGITLMRMDEGMDTGDMLATAELAIAPDDNALTLAPKLAELAAQLGLREIPRRIAGELPAVPQSNAEATMAPKLAKELGVVDWQRPAKALHDLVRGLTPWPGASTTALGEPLKITRTALPADAPSLAAPGTLVAITPAGWRVATGEGDLLLETVQVPGKPPRPAADLARGWRELVPGLRLGAALSSPHPKPEVPLVAKTILSGRELALLNLLAIEGDGSYANLTGSHHAQTLPGPERRLAHELTQGVTRRRLSVDWLLAQLLKEPLAKLPAPIRNILRLGTYQIMYLERIPAAAAVDEAVKLAHRYGHAGVAKLVNGVLRNLIRRQADLVPPTFEQAPVEALQFRYGLPEWLAKRWYAAYGAEAEALGQWSIQPPRLALRVNTLATTVEAVRAAFEAAGIAYEPSPVVAEGLRLTATVDVTALPGYNEGWWYVQDEGAMLVADCLAPRPGETVIDVGAAPGGKTTHLAQLMANQGEIFAVDQRGSRLERLQENCRRLGVTNVQVVERDATDLTGLPAADRILLDVPCSGLGVLPRKPDLRFRQSPEAIAGLVPTQLALLAAAAGALKPGGTMVYATCTISPEENQAVISQFLAHHPTFQLASIADCLPEAWRDGVESTGMIQLLPPRHGVDGFFIAKLQRSATP